MAWAAMATVPRVDTVDWIASFPNWNMLFSIPDGIPMSRIFFNQAPFRAYRHIVLYENRFIFPSKLYDNDNRAEYSGYESGNSSSLNTHTEAENQNSVAADIHKV